VNTGLVAHPPHPALLRYVIAHLRERDRREIHALRWDNDPAALLQDMVHASNRLWRVWCLDGEPIAVMGATPARPGVALIACFGTDQWPRALRAMTRYARYELTPDLAESCVHRVEAHVLASNTDAIGFIEANGGEREAVLHEFGRDREDFLLYRWRVNDVLRRWQLAADRAAVPTVSAS
jgi:hypothetical protein